MHGSLLWPTQALKLFPFLQIRNLLSKSNADSVSKMICFLFVQVISPTKKLIAAISNCTSRKKNRFSLRKNSSYIHDIFPPFYLFYFIFLAVLCGSESAES